MSTISVNINHADNVTVQKSIHIDGNTVRNRSQANEDKQKLQNMHVAQETSKHPNMNSKLVFPSATVKH